MFASGVTLLIAGFCEYCKFAFMILCSCIVMDPSFGTSVAEERIMDLDRYLISLMVLQHQQ